MFTRALSKTGRDFNTIDTFKAAITTAGFTNIHEKTYKVPFGEWARSPVLKEAGKFHKIQLMEGMEGYTLFCLTKFGEPEPWSAEEVQVYLAKVRQELADPKLHCYIYKKRVWASPPFLDSSRLLLYTIANMDFRLKSPLIGRQSRRLRWKSRLRHKPIDPRIEIYTYLRTLASNVDAPDQLSG